MGGKGIFHFLHSTGIKHTGSDQSTSSKPSCVASSKGLHSLFYKIGKTVLTSKGCLRTKCIMYVYVYTNTSKIIALS